MWQMRNVSEVVQLWGLYEGPSQSVLVTDDLIGGDLAERLCRPDFELNEGKCRRYIQQVCRQVKNGKNIMPKQRRHQTKYNITNNIFRLTQPPLQIID